MAKEKKEVLAPELRKLSNEELKKQIVECKKEVFKLQNLAETQKEKKPLHQACSERKKIARMKTVLRERELLEEIQGPLL